MDQNRLEILDRLDRGEISSQTAVRALAGEVEPGPEPPPVQTRQERVCSLSERVREWDPQHMVTLDPNLPARPWPWPEAAWQWFWQAFDRPVHVDHTLDLAGGSELYTVMYGGDLNLVGRSNPKLGIGAAAFDLRAGRDAETVRIAASTGSLDLKIPEGVSRLEARTLPGDLRIRDLQARRLSVTCESGNLRAERVRADVEATVLGGDGDLNRIEGDLSVRATRGTLRAREVRSTRIDLKADLGIDLSLGRVDRGEVLCETAGGDIELSLAIDSACDLTAEATEGGAVTPAELPWTELSERSEQTLKGKVGGGGASIRLLARGGRIYITGT